MATDHKACSLSKQLTTCNLQVFSTPIILRKTKCYFQVSEYLSQPALFKSRETLVERPCWKDDADTVSLDLKHEIYYLEFYEKDDDSCHRVGRIQFGNKMLDER